MGRVYHQLRRTSNIQNCDCSARFNKAQKTGLDRNGGVLSQKKVMLGLDLLLVLFTLSGTSEAENISSFLGKPLDI
jgi:hypothetical protein